MTRPLIGLTADLAEDRCTIAAAYCRAIEQAGGLPMLLPPLPDLVGQFVHRCDAIVLTGGDDPVMEGFGVPTHPAARPMHPQRQAFELALLEALDEKPETPVLGICLGMQLMALHAGGMIDQHLPDSLATHADHAGKKMHRIEGELVDGKVWSNHHQAVSDAGSLAIVARAHDGVIEAVRDEGRGFCLGVQWHPERTDDSKLGIDLFKRLVEAAAARVASR